MNPGGNDSEDGSSSSDGDDADEIARFEEDTESFMLRKREFQFPGIPAVVLNQDFVSLGGTGGAVWRPSIQFSSFVCGEEGRHHLPLTGKSVLEISSGLGLGAIVAWHLGASPVVATDIESESGPMALLTRNVAENCGPAPRNQADHRPSPRDGADRCATGGAESVPQQQQAPETVAEVKPPPPPAVQSLRWGEGDQLEEALANFDGFGPDVVLACDVVYDDALLPALAETLAGACARPARGGARPRLCVSHQSRNRRREDSFFTGLAARLGGGEWRAVNRRNDLSVLIFEAASL